MAIFFPPESPVKWFTGTDKQTKAAAYESQRVHLYDDGHFQFWDETHDSHRVVILDDTFAVLAELSASELSVDVIGTKNVFTSIIAWDDHLSLGDLFFLAIIDAYDNYFFANFLPNGSFDSASGWTIDAGMTIAGGQLEFAGTGLTSDAEYDSPLTVGKEYTITVTYANVVLNGLATLDITILNNGSSVGTVSPSSSGTLTATFTAAATDLVIRCESTGDASVNITEVSSIVTAGDASIKYVSAPFCVRDLSNFMLVHCCAVNDYFNTFYASTGYVPRIRIDGEVRDAAPLQDVEQYISTNGKIINYFVQNVSQQELRIDCMPTYLINFLSVVFYMDFGAIDNIAYRPIESPEFNINEDAPDIAQATIMLGAQETSAGFKRVVTDPSTASCQLSTGAYISQNDGTSYSQQSTSQLYYPQN